MTKILFITLSNIGDVILTLPVLDALKEKFSKSNITVMVGQRPKAIFERNPYIYKMIVFDKHAALREKIKLFFYLRKEHFDIIVDLRNTFFTALLPARYKTSSFLPWPASSLHMKDRHLAKLKRLFFQMHLEWYSSRQETTLFVEPQDKAYINALLEENKITPQDKFIVVSPGARSHLKRWTKENFLEMITTLIRDTAAKIVLVGERDDAAIASFIRAACPSVVDLTAKTSIPQLAYLLGRCRLVIANDSATLHLASYLNIPVVAIFGPSNDAAYGPWSDRSAVVKKEIFCRPCAKAQCRFAAPECMSLIKVEEVLEKVNNILNPKFKIPNSKSQIQNQYKRILIVRTDRIGDVLLSTPVIRALRETYPDAYIAMMVSPYAKDIVEGNPYLDSVIIYDKDGKHKSWQRTFKFARNLKKKKFDLALILHPTNRVHLVIFLACIPRRIGYDRKFGFLLSDRIRHTKQLGEKHEVEYNLDLVRYLGIEPEDKNLFMPIKAEAERWAEAYLRQEGIREDDKLAAIHPGASCPSKIWPNERFAQVADSLKERYGFRVLVLAGSKDIAKAQAVVGNMRHPAVNLAGKTSVAQLASVLKRCQIFISNDSGPVHIASAVGTPVISIFGRNQKGLSPRRWGPLGLKDKVLHQEVGCIECLAHHCQKSFACLKAITVADVLKAADSILK